ncbi:MAG TPA: SufE family protein [Alphaproteobacteria bacterium]|nr:SufE family protein [Alphaproteobacteria bacterium]
MSDLARYEEFVEALAMLDDEEMRFEYILDLAKRHKDDPFPDEWMTDANLMHGCMSKVWIVHEMRNAKNYFRGRSDAAIVNGLVTMMTDSFSGLTAEELRTITLDHVRKLNLGALTTQRQVGMMAMLKHLQKLGVNALATMGDRDDGPRPAVS